MRQQAMKTSGDAESAEDVVDQHGDNGCRAGADNEGERRPNMKEQHGDDDKPSLLYLARAVRWRRFCNGSHSQ